MSRFRNRHSSFLCIVLGAISFVLAATSFVLSRNFFDPATFGLRASDSLADPGVSAYAADLVANEIVRRRPDLIAFRPVVVSAAQTVVSTKAFRAVVERAAARANQAVFSEGSQSLLLSLPDLDILVREALGHADPALAARLPRSLDATIAGIARGNAAAIVLRLARTAGRLAWMTPLLFALALSLYLAGLRLAPDRRRGAARCGIGLLSAGLVLAGLVALNPVAGLWISDEKQLAFVRGLWRVYLGDLARWGFLYAGLGVLVASGASSLLDRFDFSEQLARAARRLTTAPATPALRAVRGLALFLVGGLLFFYPALALNAVTAVLGVGIAYLGSRELFAQFRETLEAAESRPAESRRRAAIPIAVLVILLGAAWVLWRNPVASPVRAWRPVACNGFPELCDRSVDEVVFAGAHNAMSNQDAAGWMFPHHQAGMDQMLRDGVRAFLVDVHYGFETGSRVKTDMRLEPTADKIKQAVGEEAFAAAMRIRDRLVGVDESKRGLYFCHGFCELGAYPVAPALRRMRDFLVAHPDEVVLFIVEDTVTPEDLAGEFDKAGFADLIYTGPTTPRWPILRELIESGRRVVLFTESGKPGVPWLRPAFESFRETPYSFHKVEEFSCRANRGGDSAPLFLMNHWIETTPTPKPSNAEIVNASTFLLGRARLCAAERRHLPNIIAVDFYATGDVVAVVNELNGVSP